MFNATTTTTKIQENDLLRVGEARFGDSLGSSSCLAQLNLIHFLMTIHN